MVGNGLSNWQGGMRAHFPRIRSVGHERFGQFHSAVLELDLQDIHFFVFVIRELKDEI